MKNANAVIANKDYWEIDMSEALKGVKQETILRSAHRNIGNKFLGYTLWGWVQEMCGVGSTTAVVICKELGWNPTAQAVDPLPPSVLPNESTPDNESLVLAGWRPYHVPGRWIDPQGGALLKTFEAIKEQRRRDL